MGAQLSEVYSKKKRPFQAIISILTHGMEGLHFSAYPDDFGPSPFSSSVKGGQWDAPFLLLSCQESL